jgi:hypothetical protein
MMSVLRLFILSASALLMMTARGAAARAAGLDAALSADGVYTWTVAATDEAPAWCCYRWVNDSPIAGTCDLDRKRGGFGYCNESTLDGEVQIYASIEAGKAQRIRALSPECPVRSRREVRDLGTIDGDESVAWLTTQVQHYAKQSGDVLAAIAVHRVSSAMRYLSDLADAAPVTELRKDAIFWMGQVRIAESAGELERLMFRDDSPEIRQHAAFSLAQSHAPTRGPALIRQGRDDRDTEVRAQAWFWLAQTGLPESEEAIRWAIVNDRDEDVREEAVFALSQLPDERSVDALFDVLGDRQLPQDVREKALFWLAQSDSNRAFEYLDRLLTKQ